MSEGRLEARGASAAVRAGSSWLRAAAGVLLFLAGAASGVALGPGIGSSVDSEGPVASRTGAVAASDETTLEESEELMREAERRYLEAMFGYRDQLSRTDASVLGPGADPVGRLVMLENLMAATEAAVREVPADPFFNGLLVSTAAERRATLDNLTFVDTGSW